MSSAQSARHIALPRRLFYSVLHLLCRILAVVVFDFRCYGREHLVQGRSLLLSTHQSHFDPLLVGLTLNRRMSQLARHTLFKNRLLAFFIRLLDAIELDRDRSGLAGLRETLSRLKQDEIVLIFPEGTRSKDGAIGQVKAGFLSVARRSQAPLLPMAITGAFNVLPRGSLIPRVHPIQVSIGKAIHFDQYSTMSDEQILAMLHRNLVDCASHSQRLSRL
jgi:1-acyl-sn-glycerol-3-phosphate acyltransferase